MGSIPFALSVSHFVNTVGAKAGFAAILGLAVLILLYFAQARETATLRDHAAEATERIRQLEGRINQLVRAAQVQAQQLSQPRVPASPAAASLRQGAPGRIASAPAGALVGARPGPAPAGAAPPLFQQPIAPAGVGAPALTAATKLIPTDVPAPPAAPPAPAFDEELAGAGSNGHTVGQGTVQAPPRPTGAGTLLAAAQGTAPPAGGNPPRVQIGGPAGAGQRRPPAGRPFDVAEEEPPPSPTRRILAGLAGLVVIAAIVVVLIEATSSGGGSPHATTAGTPTTNAPTTTTRHKHHGAPAVNPANVDVAVLNGTATANAAKGISDQLTAKGYKPGCVTNALTQTQTTTQIAYFDTFRRDALAVAKVLKLPSGDVTPINSSTESISCAPQPPITNSNVVVTIGSDLAAAAGASTTGSSAGQAATGTGTGAAAPPPTGTQPVGTGTGTNPTSTVG